MAYRLRRPPEQPRTARRVGGGNRRRAPDPERRSAITRAFVEFYGRLEALLGKHWLGAWNELERLAPLLATELGSAEDRVDVIARAFVHHQAKEEEFHRELRDYEAHWERAAAFLKACAREPQGDPCSVCGRTDARVTLLMDDGVRICSRCYR